jgi:prepilin signal peptidase PulO-like enzyme (type II secretory pathway)
MGHGQDAEKFRQRRSRIVQTFNVPPRVPLGPSLAAALLTAFLSILLLL